VPQLAAVFVFLVSVSLFARIFPVLGGAPQLGELKREGWGNIFWYPRRR
jgi:hypothetical protein